MMHKQLRQAEGFGAPIEPRRSKLLPEKARGTQREPTWYRQNRLGLCAVQGFLEAAG